MPVKDQISQITSLFYEYLTHHPELKQQCITIEEFYKMYTKWCYLIPGLSTLLAKDILHRLQVLSILKVNKKTSKIIFNTNTNIMNKKRQQEKLFKKILSLQNNELAVEKGIHITDINLKSFVLSIDERKSFQVVISNMNPNTSNEAVICLESVKLIGNKGNVFFTSPSIRFITNKIIKNNESYSFELVGQPRFLGIHRALMIFIFDNNITVSRMIEIRCGDQTMEDFLKPTTPYKKPKRTEKRRLNITKTYDGERPTTNTSNNTAYINKLPMYGFDKKGWLVRQQQSNEHRIANEEYLSEISQSQLLNQQNYKNYFTLLMCYELLQMEIDIRDFDMTAVRLDKVQQGKTTLFRLKVPGLAESRPSVLRGDSILITNTGTSDKNAIVYTGVAWKTELDYVYMNMHNKFQNQFIQNQHFDIVFTFSKVLYRHFLQGLEKSNEISGLIYFPIFTPISSRKPRFDRILTPVSLVYRNRELNERQKVAVCGMLNGSTRPAPYILYGPPGTGKTVTLIETILQFHRLKPAIKILICAPSNTAADIFIQRLNRASILPSEMIRVNAYGRDRSSTPSDVLQFCTESDDANGFKMPSLYDLQNKSIIVATCATAAKLYNIGMTTGHFDVIIIDEVGQAWEPQVVACVGCFMRPSSDVKSQDQQLIIAGDPKQLGPVVRSSIARQYGLAM